MTVWKYYAPYFNDNLFTTPRGSFKHPSTVKIGKTLAVKASPPPFSIHDCDKMKFPGCRYHMLREVLFKNLTKRKKTTTTVRQEGKKSPERLLLVFYTVYCPGLTVAVVSPLCRVYKWWTAPNEGQMGCGRIWYTWKLFPRTSAVNNSEPLKSRKQNEG